MANHAQESHEHDHGHSEEQSTILMYTKFLGEIISLVLYLVWVMVKKSVFFVIPRPAKSVKNEIVLVTGGANGIGREICIQLAKKEPSLSIVIWDVNEAKTRETVAELEALGIKKAAGFKVDVSDREQVKIEAEKLRSQIGDVTILFNNHGIPSEVGPGWTMDPKRVEKVFHVNLISHCWTLQEFLPAMIEKGKGHVIETCSLLGVLWGKDGSPYTASKHGLKAYIECIKEDVRGLPNNPKINFSIAYPHHTLTAMTEGVNFSSSKYPFLVHHMSPGYVASKIIEGTLQNEEHIYIPSMYRSAPMYLGLLPPEIFRKLTDFVAVDCQKIPRKNHLPNFK